jgi:catechol 2,3-dioxygenase-like lactoylglutathione lyase family enzyme
LQNEKCRTAKPFLVLTGAAGRQLRPAQALTAAPLRWCRISENRLVMAIRGLSPMLRTTDLERSVRFYTETVGFVCEKRDSAWATVRQGGVRIMLALPNAHEPFEQAAFTGSLYLYVDDIDDLWNRLKDAARVCYTIETFDYGMREFAIYDDSGYVLQFGQEAAARGRRPKGSR